MSKIYLEILDKSRRATFEKLKNFSSLGYLAGGTALSLQIHHRKSFDFDIFIDKPLKRSLIKKCQQFFGGDNLKVIRQNSDQITFISPENIKLDFVYYWHQPVLSLVKTAYINLASVLDISADKAASIGRRAVWRDYVDIFFLLKQDLVPLEKLIATAKKKFRGEFNELLFLEQLVFFKDLEMTKIDFIQKSYSEKQIKGFLKTTVRDYLEKQPLLKK